MSAQSLRVPQTGFHKGPLPAQAKHIAWPHLPRPYGMTRLVLRVNTHNSELFKMPELFGIANHPYFHYMLLGYSHGYHREGMTIYSYQDGWLPIRFRDLSCELRLNIALRSSNHKPRDGLWSMQDACGCSSHFAPTVGRQNDIRGQEMSQSIQVAFFGSFQELLQELMVMLN